MTRQRERILRHAADGATWKVTPQGSTLKIEIVFDDEPGRVIVRERVLPPDQRESGLAGLIAEQEAEGFVLEPPWTPTAAWIAEAPADQLVLEVVDAWVLALYAKPALFPDLPGPVRSFLAVHVMVVQATRNGLSSFVREELPELTTHLGQAARDLGLEEVESLYTRATAGLDLRALAGTNAGRVRWSDAAAAARLEAAATETVVVDRLIDWVREHAEDFAKLPG